MKIRLELNIVEDSVYLNFWDSGEGNDVIAELRDNQLILHTASYDHAFEQEISFKEFVDKVKEAVEIDEL